MLADRLARLRQQPPGGLQVFPSGAARRCAPDQTGRRALRHGLVRQGGTRGAYEAPGRSPRRLPQGLHAAGLETVGAHPQHARRCAEALGQLAQTVRGKAAMLARLEACEAAPPAPQQILERPDLEAPRRLLAQQREALGQHLQEASLETCRRALRAVLRGLARRLQRLPARLAATLAAAAGLLGGAPCARASGLRSGARHLPGGPAPSACGRTARAPRRP